MRLCVWLSEQAEFLFRPSPSPAQSRPKRFGAAPGLTLRGRSSKPSPKRQFSKRRKNSSDGPLSSRSGTELFTRSGGGRRSPAFPNHIRKIPIIHLFAGYTETRPDNKALRKNGRQFLSPKIARPPYPSRENHGSFSPGTARDFQSESPPTVPHLEKRKPAASLGKRRQYPDSTVIRPCRRPRGESWERYPPDCCAPAPEYTTAHGRYPLRAAEPAACSRRCACGTSASV